MMVELEHIFNRAWRHGHNAQVNGELPRASQSWRMQSTLHGPYVCECALYYKLQAAAVAGFILGFYAAREFHEIPVAEQELYLVALSWSIVEGGELTEPILDLRIRLRAVSNLNWTEVLAALH